MDSEICAKSTYYQEGSDFGLWARVNGSKEYPVIIIRDAVDFQGPHSAMASFSIAAANKFICISVPATHQRCMRNYEV